MRKRGIAIVVLGVLMAGCSGQVADTSESSSSDSAGLTNQECMMLEAGAVAAGGVSVVALTASGECEGGVLVTTAGTATPLCVVPLAVSALAALTAVVESGIAVLSCSNGASDEVTPTTTTGTASTAWCQQLIDSYHSWCAAGFSCNGSQTCAQLGANINAAMRCRDQRQQYADQCYGGADDGHQEAIDNANTALQNCIATLAFKQANFYCE